jgi:hypothetical protein
MEYAEGKDIQSHPKARYMRGTSQVLAGGMGEDYEVFARACRIIRVSPGQPCGPSAACQGGGFSPERLGTAEQQFASLTKEYCPEHSEVIKVKS